MAASSGKSVEKMQFIDGAYARHSEMQWFPDERDSYIAWLKGEFAAANAIIDVLCQHFKAIGGNMVYDRVIESIHKRRFNWIPIIHMQQYFSIAEVILALDQVASMGWQRQQRHFDHNRSFDRDSRKNGHGYRHGHKFEGTRENHGSAASLSSGVAGNADETRDKSKKVVDPKQTNGVQRQDGNSSKSVVDKEGSHGTCVFYILILLPIYLLTAFYAIFSLIFGLIFF